MKRQLGATAFFFALALPVILLDRYGSGNEADDLVVLTGEVSKSLSFDFQNTTGKPPGPAELKRLEERWVRDELMLQRAKSLGIADGDPIIRRRLLHKMRELASLGPGPSTETLQAYYAEHASEYATPERVDVDVVLPKKTDNTDSLVQRLRAGADPGTVGRPSSLGVRQRGLTAETLRRRLAVEDPNMVIHQSVGTWAAHSTASGMVIIRVVQSYGAAARPFAQVQSKIYDLLDSRLRRERLNAFEEALYTQWKTP
jgi:hypothetical protein